MPTVYWGQIEATIGLITASLPSLNFLLVRLIPKRFRPSTRVTASLNNVATYDSSAMSPHRKGFDETEIVSEKDIIDLYHDRGRSREGPSPGHG